MSIRLRDRIIRVEVGVPGGEGVALSEELRVDFTVDQTRQSSPDKAELKIHGLTRTTAALFTQDDERRAVLLYAGYREQGEPTLLFVGEIREAKTIGDGTERITRIKAADGGADYRSARLNRSWRGGVRASEILRAVTSRIGTPVELPAGVSDIEFPAGYHAEGPARKTLDSLAKTVGFDWAFEGGAVVVTVAGEPLPSTAPDLNAQTGLIGSPESTKKGINGTSLLNPRIRPRRLVNIASEETNGFFLVQAVTHKGSNYANEFYTEFEARQV